MTTFLEEIQERTMASGLDFEGDLFVRHPQDEPDDCRIAISEGMVFERSTHETIIDFMLRISGIGDHHIWFLMP